MILNEQQQEAVSRATKERFLIVNGGAGVGKTCVIKNIAAAVEAADGRNSTLLCAFAGKAAARIREATGHAASTIHSMLQYDGERFLRTTLEHQTVIIDEASMVNSNLLAEICKRDPKRLILVGDEAQLPPVGLGQPFHDLVRLKADKTVTLTTCYRNKEAIYQAATKIRRGEMPERQVKSDEEIWRMMPMSNPRDVHAAILSMVRNGDFDFEQDIILVPRNDDEANDSASVKSLNRDILEIVNPHKQNEKFKAGDRIINTQNQSELDIWNGTTATITAVEDAPRGRIYLHLDSPAKDAATGELTSDIKVTYDVAKYFKHAYALTVHKSQGSQYRKVVFVCLGRDSFALLNRPMVYTAITRAQQECIVIGEMAAFGAALRQTNNAMTIIQLLASLREKAI